MTLFYLVRHGYVERSRAGQDIDPTNPPLSQLGRAEAAQVAANLHARPIARVYSSPLRRAQETATPIAAIFGLQLILDLRLRERIHFGDLPGQTLEEFVALWERCSRERDFVPPIGDSSRGAGQRLEAFMTAIHAEVPVGEVVALTHRGTIADFLLNICSPTELAQISPAFAAQPYDNQVMRNGAITVVEYTEAEKGAQKYTVKAIALTAHLEAT